jgi:hypothetical protein
MRILFFLLLLLNISATTASAQEISGNRRKVIYMLLSRSHTRAYAVNYNQAANIYKTSTTTEPAPQGFRTTTAIPRYSLAKGAVICRLEEYVQLHSPFKLNIGVGGE